MMDVFSVISSFPNDVSVIDDDHSMANFQDQNNSLYSTPHKSNNYYQHPQLDDTSIISGTARTIDFNEMNDTMSI